MKSNFRRTRLWSLTAVLLFSGLLAGILYTIAYSIEVDLPELAPVERPQDSFIPEPPEEDPESTRLPPMEFFHDMTAKSGIDFICRNGEEAGHLTLLETLGGGVALIDYDGDGLLDIFLVGGGRFDGKDNKEILGCPCRLYKNLGNWKFRDVTAQAGLDKLSFYSHGCAVADFNCDGWPDLLVTGYGQLALFRNDSDGRGGRKFVDVTEAARLRDRRWNTGAAWADLDGDGYPDLYVCHYVDWSWKTHRTCTGDAENISAEICPPGYFQGTAHCLYRNNQDGTFTDVSKEAGLRQGNGDAGMGLGVVVVDVNDDRRPDIYAVNDTTMNFLLLNESTPGKFHFKEIGLESGVAMGGHGRPNGSMGVDAADYDGSGRPALWVTAFERERHALYRNISKNDWVMFQYVSQETGIGGLGSGYVGFGTGFIDVDNDGWEDLVIANGHVRRYPTRSPVEQKTLILKNNGAGRFFNMSIQGGAYFQIPHRGRGLAIGDLDNDGRSDLVIAHQNAPAVLLRNEPRGAQAPRNHWLGIELTGRKKRDVAGAKVVVEVGNRQLTRFAKGGGSYLSSSDRRMIIGLGGTERIGRVSVYWPWGEAQHWDGLKADRYWRLVEGEVIDL